VEGGTRKFVTNLPCLVNTSIRSLPRSHVHEPISRDMNAMERRHELLSIGRLTRKIIGWSGVVINLAQGHTMPAPPSLECAAFHVINENPLVKSAIGDVDLLSILVEIEIFDSGQYVGSLVVLLYWFVFRPAMPEIPQKFIVAGEFDNAVSRPSSRQTLPSRTTIMLCNLPGQPGA
jgi:hypothetical protein